MINPKFTPFLWLLLKFYIPSPSENSEDSKDSTVNGSYIVFYYYFSFYSSFYSSVFYSSVFYSSIFYYELLNNESDVSFLSDYSIFYRFYISLCIIYYSRF